MHIRSSHLEKALAAMQVPFLQLTRLMLDLYNERCQFFRSFLGWIYPRLRLLRLDCIHFLDYRNYPCPLLNSSNFSFVTFLPDTFFPRRWPLPFSHRPTLNHLGYNQIPSVSP